MAIVETRISVWEALAGRAPGQPLGPADPGLWTAVAERVNPAKARPVLRAGIEESHLVSARGVAYTMLRSPDGTQGVLPAAHPGRGRAGPPDGRLAHAGPAGGRVRPHLRSARARPGPPGRGRPGRQPDAARSCRSTRSPRCRRFSARPLAGAVRPGTARVRPGPADGAGQHRPDRHRALQGRRAAAVHPGHRRAVRHGRGARAVRVRLPVVHRRAVGVPDQRLVRWSGRRCCSD